MTDDVSQLVLSNNYQQTLALSVARKAGMADFPHQVRFMTALEARGLLDRAVETLPSAAALAEREARREPLTRAELGVLLAYAKIVLFSDIVASDVPDDPHFERDLSAYFPDRMEKKFAADIASHRLRREVIARVVANDLINRGGPSFVTRLMDATGTARAKSCGPSPSCATVSACRRSIARSTRSTTGSTARSSSISMPPSGGWCSPPAPGI